MVIESFATAAASWQGFYLLTGTAAATLIGLMFVAVTFGASANRVDSQQAATARAFLDPPFYHFAQVLLVACLMAIPTMTARFFGITLLLLAAYRVATLLRVYRQMRLASATYNDLDVSDWLSGVVVPTLCHAVLAASAVGFVVAEPAAFNGLALATLAILAIGIYGAWELLLWLAITRAKHG